MNRTLWTCVMVVVVGLVLAATSNVSQASLEYALDHGAGNCDFIATDSQDLVNLNVYATNSSFSYINQLKVVWAGIPAGTAARVLLLSIDDSATMVSQTTPNYFHVLAEVDTSILGSQRNPQNDIFGSNIPAPVWSSYTLPSAVHVTTQRFAIATIAYNNWKVTYCGNVMSDSDPTPSPDASWVGSAVNLSSDLSNINGNFRDLTVHTPSWPIPNMFRAEATAAPGTTYSWNGFNWSASTDWTPATGTPGANDTANFLIGGIGGRTVTLGGDQSVFAMNITSTTPYTFNGAGNTLTLGGGGLNVTNPATQVFNCIVAGATTITLSPQTAVGVDQYHTLWTQTVQLANVANTFTGAINVQGGTLQYNADGSLGNASNPITLGSPGTIGTLQPFGSASGTTLATGCTRNVTLAGMGGNLWPINSADPFYYKGVLSGPGELIMGPGARLMMTSSTDSTYAGGTRILNGWSWVGSAFDNYNIQDTTSADVLGTGGVRVEYGGLVLVNRATNLGIGTFGGKAYNPNIFIGGYNRNTNAATTTVQSLINDSNVGVKSYMAVGPNFTAAPNITSDSDGGLFLEGNTNSTINTRLAAGSAQLGNGLMTYGCRLGGRYTGASLMADLDNVYRFSGWNNFYIQNGVLNDNDGSHHYGVDVSNGLLLFVDSKNNTFSGNLTIENSSTLWLENGGTTNATYTPLGAATGNVILSNTGQLKVGGYTHNQLPIVKNDLSFNGSPSIDMDNGSDALTPTILNLTTLTRNDRSTLYLEGQRNKFGVNTGTYLEQINVATNAPASDGAMVSPVYTSNERFNINGTYAAGYYTFLNYGATGTAGFSYAPFTVSGSITGGSTANGIVASQADFTGIASTDIAGVISTVATASGGTTVKALMTTASITGTGALTLTSGGIINDAGVTYSCPINFGSAEGIVYARNGTVNFNGAITGSNGLTKSGTGTLNLKGDSSATLFGQITVDQGTLWYQNDYGQGDTDKVLGAPGNSILLDGGTLGFGANMAFARSITIGPAGGTFSGNGSMTLTGLISGPGTFIISATNSHISNPNNSYAGGTYVTGTADVTTNGALSTGPVTLSGNVWLDSTSFGQRFTLIGNAQLWGHNSTVSIGSLEGTGTSKVILNADNNAFNTALTVGSDNTSTEYCGTIMNYTNNTGMNGSIVKTGTGTLTLSGYNIYTGTTTVNAGELDINGTLAATGRTSAISLVTVNSTGAFGGTGVIQRDVTVNGGTLKGGLTITGALTTTATSGTTVNMTNAEIDGGATVNGGALAFTDSALKGSFTMSGGSFTAAAVNAGGVSIMGSISGGNVFDLSAGTVSGPISVVDAHVYIHGGTFNGVNNGLGNATIYAPTVWLQSGSMTGATNIAIDGNVSDSLHGTPGFYLNAGGGGAPTASFNGSITGNVYVQGGTLSGTHTIAGNVQVGDYNGDGSHPVFSGASNITGNVTVGLNGAFTGNHTVHGSLITAVGSHAVVGASSDILSAGTMTVVGDVTLDHSTKLNFNLGSPGTAGSGINDLIDITGNLSLDGTLNVTNLSGFGVGTYRLFNYTGALLGAGTLLQGTVPANLTYAIDTSIPGQINLGVTTPYIAGDTDHSGGSTLNTLDIDAIYQHFGAASTSQWKVFPDTNPVGQEDVTYEVAHYMLTNYADANLDRYTDFTDFQVLLDHWQAPGGWAEGDFNGDGTVDFLDFQVLLDYWNPTGWSAGASQVPEPASLSLLLLGGLAMLRRKK